jgi:hypothetical protein
MNMDDIYDALRFLYDDGPKTIGLMCKTAQDIPYVKRALIQTLGQPSKMIDNALYYDSKRLMIIPSTADESRIRGLDTYYVAWKDNSDWNELCANAGVKIRQVPYELTPWMTLTDIYNLMVADGLSGDVALHKMYIDGLIEKGDDNDEG